MRKEKAVYLKEEKKIYGLSGYGKLVLILAGILVGFSVSRIFFFMPFIVLDNSMSPGFKKGNYTIIYKTKKVKEGSAVLFKSPLEPGKVMLKRLIAAGEKNIEIREKKIFINDKEYVFTSGSSSDPRLFPKEFTNRDNMDPVPVKKDQLFMIGDNFDYSYDSREFGPVDRKQVIGKVIFKF